jgi:hydroxymethylbilane synthase
MPGNLIVGVRMGGAALRHAEAIVARLRNTTPTTLLLIPIGLSDSDFFHRPRTTAPLVDALLARRIDVAVIPVPELAATLPAEVTIAAYPPGRERREAVVYRADLAVKHLQPQMTIATPSALTQAQLAERTPHLRFAPLSEPAGRLRALDDGRADAAVLPLDELTFLEGLDRAHEAASIEKLVPAIGQGLLALLCRANDHETLALLRPLRDAATALLAGAERTVLRELESERSLPLGVLARIEGDELVLLGALASLDGLRVFRGEARGRPDEPEAVGLRLADEFVRRGARVLLGEVLEETRLGPFKK